jgi:hypothetical protein
VTREISYCVAWRPDQSRLEMAPLDVIVNLNKAAFLDDKPGLVVVHVNCTEGEARRYIGAFAPMLGKRSVLKIDGAGS